MLNILPAEILEIIFLHLHGSDLLAVSEACQWCREVSATIIADKMTIVVAGSTTSLVEVMSKSHIPYHHWIFKNVEVSLRNSFRDFWKQKAVDVNSLVLDRVNASKQGFINLLLYCTNLQSFALNGLPPQAFMTGDFVNNACQKIFHLQYLKEIEIFSIQYLTDDVFSYLMSSINKLESLSMAGCKICYQKTVCERFYPRNESLSPSKFVLTFDLILSDLGKNASSLKSVDLSKTSIDNEAVMKLVSLPNIKLEKVHLMQCDQLQNRSIKLLVESQKFITDLDISFNRLTDYSVFYICENLPHLRRLRLNNCGAISGVGIQSISLLNDLELLDLSYIRDIRSEHLHTALTSSVRPKLKWLNLTSVPVTCDILTTVSEKLINLVYLNLAMCPGVCDKSVQAVCKNLVKLRSLVLIGCNMVSDIGLASQGLEAYEPAIPPPDSCKIPLGLKAEQKIREAARARKYIEENIDAIVYTSGTGLPNIKGLQELNLKGCTRITSITLCHAIKHVELRILDLSHCEKVAEDGLIMMVSNCRSIEELMLTDCWQTTDQVILAIAHHLRRIRILTLQNCTKLTDDSLDSLQNCHTLRYLDVSGCKGLSLTEAYKLQQRIPKLLELHPARIHTQSMLDESESLLPNLTSLPPLLSKLMKKKAFR